MSATVRNNKLQKLTKKYTLSTVNLCSPARILITALLARYVWGIILVIIAKTSLAQHPLCNNSIYSTIGSNIVVYSNGIPVSSVTPVGVSVGFPYTIASAFSFSAPNPAFWTSYDIAGVKRLAYFNGTTWTATPHSLPFNSNYKLTGNQNHVFAMLNNTVYIYSGAANASYHGTVAFNTEAIGCDDQDNFYGLKSSVVANQTLTVYDSQLVPVCGYSLVGLPATYPIIFAINGNTINVGDASYYYVGVISGTTVTFTQTTRPSLGNLGPFLTTSCHRVTSFSSSISSVSGPSLYCQQINTLVITSTANASASYQWTGPGLTAAVNSSVVNVNLPGVYTCTILTTDCPPMKSVASYTVINAGGFFNASTSSSGSLTCTSPTTQIFANPNTAQHTFSWTGPGIMGATNTATIDANVGGIYNVYITNTLSGCSSSAQVNLASSIGPLSLNTSGGDLYLCTPTTPQTITASGASSYSWSPNIAISSTLGAQITFTPGASPAYTVSGTLGVCSGNTIINIFITPSPTLVTNINNTTICVGNTVNINVSGAYAYTWNPGGLTSSGISVNPVSTTIYSVTGNYGGCLSSKEITVTVNPIPTTSISSTYSYICLGMSSTLNASGAQSYTWYPGSLVTNSIVVTPTASQVFTVIGSSSGCSSSAVYSLIVSSAPWFNLGISPSTPTVCASSALTLSATGAFNTYTWSGPGLGPNNHYTSVVVGPSVSAVYTLSASNPTGGAFPACNKTATVAVTTSPLPTIGIVASSTNICLGNSVTLAPIGGVAYSLGFAIQPPALQFTLTPSLTQIYTIIGKDALNCVGYNTVQIVVSTPPSVQINASPVNLCPGGTATLVASGASSYTWNPGGLTGSIVQVSPQSTTNYSVTGGLGVCTHSTTVMIYAVPGVTLSLSPASPTVCAGSTLSVLAGGAFSYTWQPGNTNGAILSSTPIANSQFTVIGTGPFNCKDTAYLNISTLPSPTLTINSLPNLFCQGDTGVLTAGGANTFTWQPGNFMGSSYSINPQTSTIYTLTGTNGTCTSSTSIGVSVTPSPTLTIISTPTTICAGNESTLSVFGASTYTWINTGQSFSVVAVNPTITTLYTVVGTSLGCSSTQTAQVFVYANSLQVMSDRSVICLGESATITANGALTYTWSTSQNGAQIVVSPSVTTFFTLSSTDINNCLNQSTISIQVSECVNIPESLTQLKISVFPNPADRDLAVDTESDGIRIIFYNSLGQMVREVSILKAHETIDVSELNVGMYSLNILQNEVLLKVLKLIKQ